MVEQFSKIGVENFKRINAVEIDTLEEFSDDKNKPYICDKTQKFFPNCKNCEKETCVLISHCEAIRQGVNDGHEWFVICEDDIDISQFKIDWEQMMKYIPSDAECIQMLCSNPLTVKKLYEVLEKHRALFVPYKFIIPCCGFYMVSMSGAMKILDKYRTIDGKWDFSKAEYCVLSDALIYQTCKTYVTTYPMANLHTELDSLVHPEHLDSHKYGESEIQKIIDSSSVNPLPYLCKNAKK
jgi:GR25 family glycosyltransferase involved in LPS biosynthesis